MFLVFVLEESHFQVPNSVLVICCCIKTTPKLSGIKQESSYYTQRFRGSGIQTGKTRMSCLWSIMSGTSAGKTEMARGGTHLKAASLMCIDAWVGVTWRLGSTGVDNHWLELFTTWWQGSVRECPVRYSQTVSVLWEKSELHSFF